MATFIWMRRLEDKVHSFNSLYNSTSYKLQKLQDQVDSLQKDSPIQLESSLRDALGVTEIVGTLSQYKSKADDFYRKAQDNQSALERLHTLNADTIRDVLCELEGGEAYCRKIKIW